MTDVALILHQVLNKKTHRYPPMGGKEKKKGVLSLKMMRVMLTLFLSEMVGGCSNFMLSNEYQLSVSTAITPSSLLQCSAQVLFLH